MLKLSFYRQKALEVLTPLYGEREAKSIRSLWFQERLGLSPVDCVLSENEYMGFDEFHNDLLALEKGQPIQLILGIAHFLGGDFFVDENTLVPRPETEELVLAILHKFKQKSLSVMDVGTGSGCIAIALKKERPHWKIKGVDINKYALKTAQKNANHHSVEVEFSELDALTETIQEVDLIVSNPPYIPKRELETMQRLVIDNEPHLALFVPNDDPLLFYRKILESSTKNSESESVYFAFEIHENYGDEMKQLCASFQLKEITLEKDLQGKDRMIFARHGN
jgi:release factor glutamine methyltransferase